MKLPEQATPQLTYSFGSFLLDPAEHRLTRDGHDLRLPPKVFETVVLLVERHGLLVEKDDLMMALWPGTFVEEVTLARNISLLRKALGDTPGHDQNQYIETVSKSGYRFIADVREIYQQAAPSGVPPAVEPESAAPALTKSRWQHGRIWFVVSGLVLLLTCVGAFLEFRPQRESSVEIHSLAVLPLENLSGDPDQEYFVDGMTDELITNLAQIHSLRVISRTSVMQFKHTKKTLPEIARELNVDAVVEGSVSRVGQDVSITAQLLDARQDRHLWAASYQRQVVDVLSLQTQMAKAIADQVKANLTPVENAHLTQPRPRNPEAYDVLLRGRFLRNRRDPKTSQKALAYFQQAVAIDPNNAEAWAALAGCYAGCGGDLRAVDSATVRSQALAAIQKALELNPDLSEAHATSGNLKLLYDWDWAGAKQEYQRAIELNPNNSTAHRYYGGYLLLLKRFDEALEENRRAIDLDPLDLSAYFLLADIYHTERLGSKTIEQSERMLEMDPNFIPAYIALGGGYELTGQWSEALAAYEHLRESSKPGYLSGIAHVWAQSGKRHQADAAIAELKLFSKHNYVNPLTFAEYYAHFGTPDQAFPWLEKAYRERARGMLGIDTDDCFDGLQSDPRFQDLKRRVGFR